MKHTPILLLLLASCAPESASIRSEDRGVFIPMARFRHDLNGPPPAPSDSGESRVRCALEVELAYGHGESGQSIDASEDVTFDGVQFFGPLDVDSECDLTTARARLAVGSDFGIFRFEGTTGIGANHFKVR